MAVDTYTKSGNKNSTPAKLPKEVFSEDVANQQLLNQAYESYLADKRTNAASTLNRSEVRGGGRKPWRQKGTGRARHGSIRSPIWRGGGITFGPSGNENYSKNMTKKAKRKAIRQALTLSAKDGNLGVIDSFEVKSGKTKDAEKILQKMGVSRRVLVVVEEKSDELVRSTNNIPNMKLSTARYLNVFDILNADSLILTKGSVDVLKDWLGGKK